jgi:GT2 family glycosyltransferase
MNCGMSPLEYYLRYRCAASGIQLSGLDAILPRKQYFAKSCPEINHQTQPETRPLISVLMPVYNAPEKHLEDAILSVLAQSYGNWELCITDDGSTDACTKKVLDRYRMFNSRIKLKCLKHNTGISAATNEALDRALGEYVVMLDHDDTLDPSALLEFVFELNDHPDTDVIYSDQDFIDENGDTVYTFYKPDWSPEMFRGVMYVGHLLLVRRSLAVNIGGFDSGFDRVQDFEFMLRVGEHTERIRHIPKILYHWRMHPGSIAYNADAKGKVEPLQCAAVNAHMARLGLAGQAVPHPVHAHRALILPLPQTFLPSMTIIIGQSGDIEHLNSCLASLINTGMATEILLFAEADIHISWKEVRVLPLSVNDKSGDKMINSTQLINQAMRESGGDYILFMERPMKLSPGWAERLIMYSMRSDIMMVIPLVLNADKTVVEAGLILHPQQGIEPAMCGWNSDSDGLAGSLSCAREVSAVSAACVCFRHDTIRQIGEFDELYRIADFQMADVALRALNYGLKNIYVPSVTATYYETWPNIDSADRGLDRELFMNRWADTLQAGDRYHNPNYCKDSGGFVPDGLIAKRI